MDLFFVESNRDLGSYTSDDIPDVSADDIDEVIMSLNAFFTDVRVADDKMWCYFTSTPQSR